MRIATIILRTLMGLLFIFASVTYFFKLITPPEQAGAMKAFSDGLEASGYLLPTVKVIELVCGLAFVSGRFVALASVVIAPIIFNIAMVHILLDRAGLPVATFLVLALVFVVRANWGAYQPLLTARR